MIIDNHVHVGWYSDGYHSPKNVWQDEFEAGIEEIVVSSTSTCAELYKLVIREMRELTRIGDSRIHPILWLTPQMMKSWGIRYMLHSKIRWQGVKMHWLAHREWFYNARLTNQALQVARKLNVPVLLHTGEFKECHSNVFKPICLKNKDIKFVLAHGRPLHEAKEMLQECANVWVDTSFMPIYEIEQLLDGRFIDRILFGTDVPINQVYYKDISTTDYINKCINELRQKLTQTAFEIIVNNSVYN